MAHMTTLPHSAAAELRSAFELMEKILGFVPNSILTMQRKPAIVRGFAALTGAVMDPAGEVDPGFKRLVAHMASASAGCRYCEAHSLLAARNHGVGDDRLAALWTYEKSDHFSDAERVALEFGQRAGAVPNLVTAELFERLRRHWSDSQIVEILAVVCLYGFLNRWNDSMSTDLEEAPKDLATRVLAGRGWSGGKHVTEK